MSIGLLPLEKIPLFIWGLVLFIVGGYLAYIADAGSWDQVKAAFLVFLGFIVVVFDLKRRASKAKDSSKNKNPNC